MLRLGGTPSARTLFIIVVDGNQLGRYAHRITKPMMLGLGLPFCCARRRYRMAGTGMFFLPAARMRADLTGLSLRATLQESVAVMRSA